MTLLWKILMIAAPIFIAAAVFFICRKKLFYKLAVTTVLVGLAFSGLMAFSVWDFSVKDAKTEPNSSASLEMAYAFLNEGDTLHAEEILDTLVSSTVYSKEYALCQARIFSMNGDYAAAKVLYEKAGVPKDAQEEYRAVCDSFADVAIDKTLYYADQGYVPAVENPDEVIAEAEYARLQIPLLVEEAIEKKSETFSNVFSKAVSFVEEIDTLYTSYLKGYAPDMEALDELASDAKKIFKPENALESVSLLRTARVKLLIMSGEYSKIAQNLTESADHNELLVVSALYMNQDITERDFEDTFARRDEEMYKAVLEQLRLTYDTALMEESKKVRESAKEEISLLKYLAKNPSLAKVEMLLCDYADDHTSRERSKAYMQLSKLAQSYGNVDGANEYLTSALNTIGSCRDDAFVDAMCEIIAVIHDKDNTEHLKSIDHYVETIVSHTTTIPLPSHLVSNGSYDYGDDAEGGFDNYFSDYINRKRTSVNILSVDTSAFPEITFHVGVDTDIAYSAEEFSRMMQLSDCGREIQNYRVKAQTVEDTNIILVCDTSGSMSGSAIDNLKQAVSLFVNNKTSKENIGLITFHSYVEYCLGVGTTAEELNATIESLYASGGTDIYNAMVQAVSMLTTQPDQQNIIILLSDGQDSYNISRIDQNIIQPCLQNNTVIYSMGLGYGVDSNCLNAYSEPTGGSYIYISDPNSLTAFYEYLHGMVVNRYEITFTAQDILRADRDLTLKVSGDELAQDTYEYFLETEAQEQDDKKLVHGLDVRTLLSCDEAQTVHLLGKNFESTDSISVRLQGAKISYQLSCQFASDSAYALTIPANIVKGTYDMTVSLNGHTAYFEDELIIGDEIYKTVFGDYTFRSFDKEENENGDVVVLSGNVTMNDWLHFVGSVTLSGDLAYDRSITMSESSGSYVLYSAATASNDIAKTLAANGKPVTVAPLGDIRLYRELSESTDSEDYTVHEKEISGSTVPNVFQISRPKVSLYPNYFRISSGTNFNLELPFLKEIIENALQGFTMSKEEYFYVSGTAVGADLTLAMGETGRFLEFAEIVSMPATISLADTEFRMNTYSSPSTFGFTVGFDFTTALFEGLELAIDWNGDLSLKKVEITVDAPKTILVSGVPVTFSDFMLGLDDMGAGKTASAWTYSGSVKISAAELSEILPGIEKLLGDDISVFSLDPVKLTLAAGQGYFNVHTEAKLLSYFDVGEIDMTIGKISYTNRLLGMDGVSVNGFVGKKQKGLSFDTKAIDVTLGNSIIELGITNQYIGLSANTKTKIQLWSATLCDTNTDFTIGMFRDRRGDVVFTVRADISDKKFVIPAYLSWSKRSGFTVSEIKY